MSATVKALHAVLGQLIENGLGDNELRFAYQANYPLQDWIEGIWYDEEDDSQEDEDKIVYIVSGGQDHDNPYGPKAAFENATLEL